MVKFTAPRFRPVNLAITWNEQFIVILFYHCQKCNFHTGVLASEGWWEAWKPSPKVKGMVKDKVGWPQGELGVSKSMECDIFPFSALTLLVGRQEGHPTCKKLVVGLLVVMIWLELCTTYSSSCHHRFIILSFNKQRLTQVHLENSR